MKLKEKFPDIEFMTPAEAATKLGWEFEYDQENKRIYRIYNVMCCGKEVRIRSAYRNYNYVEQAYCPICGKKMNYISELVGHLVDKTDDMEDEDGKIRLWYIPKG